MEIFQFVSNLVTVLGFPLIIWQLVRTRRAAAAAKKAAEKASKEIERTILFTDLSSCVGDVNKIKQNFKDDKLDMALYLVSELTGKLVQLRYLSEFSAEVIQQRWQTIIADLEIIINIIEERINNNAAKIDTSKVSKILTKTSRFLNDFIGYAKFNSER